MYKLIVFDYDDCIDSLVMDDMGHDVFSELAKTYKLAIASYNPYCKTILKNHHLDDFFSCIVASYHPYHIVKHKGYVYDSKKEMLTHILAALQIEKEHAIFFDDQESNCLSVADLGVKSVLVKKNDYLDMAFLEKYLILPDCTIPV